MRQWSPGPPAVLRGERVAPSDGSLERRLAARPPFDAAALLAFFAARAIPGVEEMASGRLRRTFSAAGTRPEDGSGAAVLEVEPATDGVRLRVPARAASALPRVIARVSRMFDLDADVAEIGGQLARDPRLRRALAGRTVRVPGPFDAFEAGGRALL